MKLCSGTDKLEVNTLKRRKTKFALEITKQKMQYKGQEVANDFI
jgi:hypothetical protein